MASNKAILQYPGKKQFLVTIPKGLVFAKKWKKGDLIDIELLAKNHLILRRVEAGAVGNISLLQFRGGQQFLLCLPKDLILALGWRMGSTLEFTLDEKLELEMRKR